MDLKEIEKKIAEYTKKLNSTKLVQTRKGIKRRSAIPGHLKNYIRTEIVKLERQKEHLEGQPVISIYISWEKVQFKDGLISFTLPNNRTSNDFPFNISRRTFQFIKPYFNKFDLPDFLIKIQGTRIESVSNEFEISSVLSLLTAQEDLRLKLFHDEIPNLEGYIQGLSKISTTHLLKLYKVKSRGAYLEYLSQLQSIEYKLIPIIESLLFSSTGTYFEDSFLFTFSARNKIIIIWESSLINRATYVFNSNHLNYQLDVQSIFEFIISNTKSKRKVLRNFIKFNINTLGVYEVIEHDDLEKWKIKISDLITH